MQELLASVRSQRFHVDLDKQVRLPGTRGAPEWERELQRPEDQSRALPSTAPRDLLGAHGFQLTLLLNFFPCTSLLWGPILCPGGWHQEFIDKNSRKIFHLPAWKKPFMQYLCFLPHRTSILLTKVCALATKKPN